MHLKWRIAGRSIGYCWGLVTCETFHLWLAACRKSKSAASRRFGRSAEFNSTMMGLPNGVSLLITSCLLKIYLAQSENHMGQPKGVSPLVYWKCILPSPIIMINGYIIVAAGITFSRAFVFLFKLDLLFRSLVQKGALADQTSGQS